MDDTLPHAVVEKVGNPDGLADVDAELDTEIELDTEDDSNAD